MRPLVRNAVLLVCVGGGYLAVRVLHLPDLAQQPGYVYPVTAILALGLYASTSGIEIPDFRKQLKLIVLALTFGVLTKAALIAGVMYLAFHTPGAVLFGVAVAQIDPLAVVALNKRTRMSPEAKTLLTAWASFDDPITVLLTVYVVTFTAPANKGLAGVGSLGTNLILSAALAIAVGGAWWMFRRRTASPARLGTVWLGRVAGAVVAVVAVAKSLLLSLAVIGMFVRPKSRTLLDTLTEYALYVGCVALGLVLVGPYHIGQGVVLGVAAYAAHAVVAYVLTIGRPEDRVRLVLGQQNGLTAILLALLLEPVFPGATSTIATAVLVVNVLHGVCNWAVDALPRTELLPARSTAGQQRPAGGLANVRPQGLDQLQQPPVPRLPTGVRRGPVHQWPRETHQGLEIERG